MEQTPFRLNVARRSLNLAGKVDLTTSKTTNVSVGGSFDYRDGRDYSRNRSMFNSDMNPQRIDKTWRVYGRFTQRFENSTDEENPSLIRDAFVSFQVDYSNFDNVVQNEKHKDNLSHYGYIGKFTTTFETTYDEVDSVFVLNANGDTISKEFGYLSNQNSILYSYEAGDLNPILSNYTTNYYNVYANDPEDHWDDINSVRTGGGLVNGDAPASVYDLFTSMGTVSNGYSKQQLAQFRVSAQGSATIKDHAIKLGFEYEQRDDRFYSVAPRTLWNLGRQLVNAQIAQRDFTVGTFTQEEWTGGFDRYTFSQAYNPDAHSTFDKNLRQSLGLAENGTEWIDFDSYGPDVWNIGMFSPDELITNGGFVNNFGYDHTGQKLSGNPSLDDFFLSLIHI